jgi:hypothetical protein
VRSREIRVPDRVVMERSGFTYSRVPTHNRAASLSDVRPEQLPSLAIHRLKHKNTPEHQNLYEPNPYRTTCQISFRPPGPAVDRALTAGAPIQRGGTGYNSNETVHARVPVDPRTARTGITEFQGRYDDPAPALRARGANARPNVMDTSGYWSQ